MGFLELFFSFHFAIFELPAIAAAIYLALLTSGAVMAEHDADVDVDHDVDLDLDAEVGLGAELEAGVDIDHDLDLDAGAGVEHVPGLDHGHPHGMGDHEPGSFLRVLAFLGIGRVPISIILMTFSFLWAFFGIAANILLGGILPGISVLLVSLPAAILGAVLGTRALALGISKVLPSVETYAVKGIQLVGSTGEALFEITEEFGRVRVFDEHNNLHDVTALVRPGRSSIEKGSRVFLTRYEAKKDTYFVRPHTERLGGPMDMEPSA